MTIDQLWYPFSIPGVSLIGLHAGLPSLEWSGAQSGRQRIHGRIHCVNPRVENSFQPPIYRQCD